MLSPSQRYRRRKQHGLCLGCSQRLSIATYCSVCRPASLTQCLECPGEATHTLRWHAAHQVWSAKRLPGRGVRPHRAKERYCKWHATCWAVQRNARGVRPTRQQEEPHDQQD